MHTHRSRSVCDQDLLVGAGFCNRFGVAKTRDSSKVGMCSSFTDCRCGNHGIYSVKLYPTVPLTSGTFFRIAA